MYQSEYSGAEIDAGIKFTQEHNTDAESHDDIRTQINDLGAEVDGHVINGEHQKVFVTNTNDATSAVDAPLKSGGGLAVAKSIFFGGAKLRHYKSDNIAPNEDFVITLGRGIYFLMISNSNASVESRFNVGLYLIGSRDGSCFVQLMGEQGVLNQSYPIPFTVELSRDLNNQLLVKNTSDATTIVQVTVVSTLIK